MHIYDRQLICGHQFSPKIGDANELFRLISLLLGFLLPGHLATQTQVGLVIARFKAPDSDANESAYVIDKLKPDVNDDNAAVVLCTKAANV
jgi:hypothetical protein